MKRTVLMLTLLLTIIGSSASPAKAGTFGTAGTLSPGHFSLGLEPEFTFSPSSFMFFIHGGVGLTHTIDLDLKLGLGSDIYFGADVEFSLVRDSNQGPGLSLALGGHGTDHFGLDTTLLLSNRFNTFSLFSALDMDMEFVTNEMIIPVYFNLGVDIPMSRTSSFILEGDIGITSSAASKLAGGISFYF